MSNTIWIVLGVFAGLIALILILKAVRARQDRLYGDEEETAEVKAAAAPPSLTVQSLPQWSPAASQK